MHRKALRVASRAVLALAAACALAGSASAQAAKPPAAAPAAKPPAGAPAGAVPKGRIAIINTGAFPEKIAELKRKIDELNTRFEPKAKELRALADTISGIEAQVKQGGISGDQLTQLQSRYEQLTRDYKRRSEDLEKEGQKAYVDMTTPIRSKLGAALHKYATDNGIILVIEIGGAIKASSVFFVAQYVNITDDFIAKYTQANP